MQMRRLLSVVAFGLGFGLTPASAQVAMSGTLVAKQECPAYQSIRKQTNPGGVTLQPGRSYPVTGKNKPEATYYQITVDGASPAQRWVDVACGDVNGAEVAPSANAHAGAMRATHVLALSWEPTFCLEHADKSECARETGQSFDSTHLSLHGLWPQPRGKAYCGDVGQEYAAADRRHDWASLPEPDLTEATKKRLAAVMPGFESELNGTNGSNTEPASAPRPTPISIAPRSSSSRSMLLDCATCSPKTSASLCHPTRFEPHSTSRSAPAPARA